MASGLGWVVSSAWLFGYLFGFSLVISASYLLFYIPYGISSYYIHRNDFETVNRNIFGLVYGGPAALAKFIDTFQDWKEIFRSPATIIDNLFALFGGLTAGVILIGAELAYDAATGKKELAKIKWNLLFELYGHRNDISFWKGIPLYFSQYATARYLYGIDSYEARLVERVALTAVLNDDYLDYEMDTDDVNIFKMKDRARVKNIFAETLLPIRPKGSKRNVFHIAFIKVNPWKHYLSFAEQLGLDVSDAKTWFASGYSIAETRKNDGGKGRAQEAKGLITQVPSTEYRAQSKGNKGFAKSKEQRTKSYLLSAKSYRDGGTQAFAYPAMAEGMELADVRINALIGLNISKGAVANIGVEGGLPWDDIRRLYLGLVFALNQNAQDDNFATRAWLDENGYREIKIILTGGINAVSEVDAQKNELYLSWRAMRGPPETVFESNYQKDLDLSLKILLYHALRHFIHPEESEATVQHYTIETLKAHSNIFSSHLKVIDPSSQTGITADSVWFNLLSSIAEKKISVFAMAVPLSSVDKTQAKFLPLFDGGDAQLTVDFTQPEAADIRLTGGKGASLAELAQIPGIDVPEGFTVTTESYDRFIASNGYSKSIKRLEDLSEQWISLKLKGSENGEIPAIEQKISGLGEKIRKEMKDGVIPGEVLGAIAASYERLSVRFGSDNISVAVRSSATAEDLPTASFAGRQDTFVNQRGNGAVEQSVRDCWISLYGNRAIQYRNEQRMSVIRGLAHKGDDADSIASHNTIFRHSHVKLAVVIQRMISPYAAGVGFTVDVATGKPGIRIEANYGLGESVVGGEESPDSWFIDPDVRNIQEKRLGAKSRKIMCDDQGSTVWMETPEEERQVLVFTDDKVIEIARAIKTIGDHYSQTHGYKFMDTEFAVDGKKAVYFVQARPETIWSTRSEKVTMTVRGIPLEEANKGTIIFEGGAPGFQGAVTGTLKVVNNLDEAENKVKEGDILVTVRTTPEWNMVTVRSKAAIVDIGGTTSHTAIVSREQGIPTFLAAGDATAVLKEFDGCEVTVDANNMVVYKGALPIVEGKLQDFLRNDIVRRQRLVTAHVVHKEDAEGQWIGKPEFSLGGWQLECYWNALALVEKELGITLGSRKIENGIIYIKNDEVNTKLNGHLKGLGIDRLEEIFKDRQEALAEFLRVVDTFELTPESFKELTDAYTRLLMHFQIRWGFGSIVMESLQNEQLALLPPDVRPIVLSYFRAPLETETKRMDDNYKRLVAGAMKYAGYFTGSITEIKEALEKNAPAFYRMVVEHAKNYKYDEVDMRLSVPVDKVIKSLQRDIKESFAVGKKHQQPVSSGKGIEGDINDILGLYVADIGLFSRTLKLAYNQSIQKENEHHIQVRKQWIMIDKFLALGFWLAQVGTLGEARNVFDLDTADLMKAIKELVGDFGGGLYEHKELKSKSVYSEGVLRSVTVMDKNNLKQETLKPWGDSRIPLTGKGILEIGSEDNPDCCSMSYAIGEHTIMIDSLFMPLLENDFIYAAGLVWAVKIAMEKELDVIVDSLVDAGTLRVIYPMLDNVVFSNGRDPRISQEYSVIARGIGERIVEVKEGRIAEANKDGVLVLTSGLSITLDKNGFPYAIDEKGNWKGGVSILCVGGIGDVCGKPNAADWNRSCNVCGCERNKALYELRLGEYSYRLVQCERCGLIFVEHVPTNKEIFRIYSGVYFSNKGGHDTLGYADYFEDIEGRLEVARLRMEEMKPWLVPGKTGSLLDVGAACGYVMQAAKEKGFDVTGVEISEDAVKKGMELFGLTIQQGTLAQQMFSDKEFDMVTMYDALEHVKDPLEVLYEINRILKNDGVLVIRVPNIDSLEADLLGDTFPMIKADHLYYLSPATLGRLLEKAGFEIKDIVSDTRMFNFFLDQDDILGLEAQGRGAHVRVIARKARKQESVIEENDGGDDISLGGVEYEAQNERMLKLGVEVPLPDLTDIEIATPHKESNTQFLIVSDCQLRCRFCINYKFLHEGMFKPFYLKWNEQSYRQLLKKLKNSGIYALTLTGGEPSVHPQLVDFVRVAKDEEMRVRITSNGLGFTEKLLSDLKNAGLDTLTFSVFSFDEKLFRKIARPEISLIENRNGTSRNITDRIKQNIKTAVDIGLDPRCNVIFTKDAYIQGKIKDIIETARGMNVRKFQLKSMSIEEGNIFGREQFIEIDEYMLQDLFPQTVFYRNSRWPGEEMKGFYSLDGLEPSKIQLSIVLFSFEKAKRANTIRDIFINPFTSVDRLATTGRDPKTSFPAVIKKEEGRRATDENYKSYELSLSADNLVAGAKNYRDGGDSFGNGLSEEHRKAHEAIDAGFKGMAEGKQAADISNHAKVIKAKEQIGEDMRVELKVGLLNLGIARVYEEGLKELQVWQIPQGRAPPVHVGLHRKSAYLFIENIKEISQSELTYLILQSGLEYLVRNAMSKQDISYTIERQKEIEEFVQSVAMPFKYIFGMEEAYEE
ncbi:MAG: PEP/pyruvate-binding domain-containing protein, partial [Candidatus Omnitrophica bacterium]|nr:PEP/pyruvate-binding domain-containing protein [Candidatus Omnitrophota bacterium]